jgi:Rod binding domain-containing protein
MSVSNSIPARQALESYHASAKAKPGTPQAKARQAAQGFESVFLQNMMESMFSGLGSDGPLGSGQAGGGAWRGFLTDEMAKSMSRTSSLGIAPQVYREMIAIQEGAGRNRAGTGASRS